MDNFNQPAPFQQPQVNPTPTPAPEPPKTFGWFKLVLIVLLVALISSGTTYFVMNQSQQNQQPPQTTQVLPTPTPDLYREPTGSAATANWKTYQDDTYKFTLNIPSSWYVSSTGGAKDKKIYPFDSFTAYNYDPNDQSNFDYQKMKLSEKVNNPLRIEIGITSDNRKTLSQVKEEWLKEDGAPGGESILVNIDSSEDTTLGSQKAVKFSYKNKLVETILTLNNSGQLFMINIYDRDHIEGNKKLFDQILSTFRFDDLTASKFTCPMTEWVDCMPKIVPNESEEIANKRKEMCSQGYLTWAKANCAGFQGAAY